MKKNRFFTSPILLAVLLAGLLVVILGCPTAAPAPKTGDKGGGGDEDEKPFVCPKAQPITETPVDKAALIELVNAAITTENPSPDLNHIDTSKVEDMSGIFSNKYTFNGDVSCWNTSSATSMNSMFSSAEVFTGDISKWKTGKVTNMNTMFFGATVFNANISSWDTGFVTNMPGMFLSAGAFNQNLSGWDVGKVTNIMGANHNNFATNAGFDSTAKHPKWCDNADVNNRHANCP